ncbi:MAG: DUF3857 domain-containing protein [Acidobacteriota bacterium]|nr:DUF3857 domain-containing protein [Acidobacteriota bacterium]
MSLDTARELSENIAPGETASIVALSHTEAFEVKANGMATRFSQTISLVRDPQAGSFARHFSITYSPRLRRVRILDAKLVRKDGSVVPAARRERPLLPDPELRMWYDSRVLELSFPRLEEGDLIDVRYTISDIGHANPIADGYFGDLVAIGTMVPVLSSRLILEAPTSLPLRYQLVNLPEPGQATLSENGETRRIQVELPPSAGLSRRATGSSRDPPGPLRRRLLGRRLERAGAPVRPAAAAPDAHHQRASTHRPGSDSRRTEPAPEDLRALSLGDRKHALRSARIRDPRDQALRRGRRARPALR